jgi:hypothetical protein
MTDGEKLALLYPGIPVLEPGSILISGNEHWLFESKEVSLSNHSVVMAASHKVEGLKWPFSEAFELTQERFEEHYGDAVYSSERALAHKIEFEQLEEETTFDLANDPGCRAYLGKFTVVSKTSKPLFKVSEIKKAGLLNREIRGKINWAEYNALAKSKVDYEQTLMATPDYAVDEADILF